MRPHVVAWLDRFFSHEVSLLIAPTWFTCVGLAGLVMLLVMMRLARKLKHSTRVRLHYILCSRNLAKPRKTATKLDLANEDQAQP